MNAADRVICKVATQQEADHLTRERGVLHKIGDDYTIELIPMEVGMYQGIRIIESDLTSCVTMQRPEALKTNKKWFHQFKK